MFVSFCPLLALAEEPAAKNRPAESIYRDRVCTTPDTRLDIEADF